MFIPFLSFIVSIFVRNVSLIFIISLKRFLVFPILLFPSISLYCSLKKAFFSLLDILWNSAYRWVYLSFIPLPSASLLFSAICKTTFLHFFFLVIVLVTTSCTMFWTSVDSSSGTLSDLIPSVYLSLPLYNNKGYDLGYTWMVQWFSLLSLSVNLAISSLSSEPQWAPGLVFADCIELLHLRLQRI